MPRNARCSGVATPVVILAAAVLAAAGCGERSGRRPISGVVTLDGRPLDEGVIQFEPAPGDPSGTFVGGPIRRGAFALAAEEGPLAGAYLVRVYAPSRSLSGGVLVDRIPGRYNTETTLHADVTEEGPNIFRFDLNGATADGDAPRARDLQRPTGPRPPGRPR